MDTPDFILDYMHAANNGDAFDKLVQLDNEYRKKLHAIEKDASSKEAGVFNYRLLTGKNLESPIMNEKRDLENEYKQKSMEVAQPFMDEVTLEKIAQKHATEQDKKNPITISQSKVVEIREERSSLQIDAEKDITDAENVELEINLPWLGNFSKSPNRDEPTKSDPGKDDKESLDLDKE